MACATAAGLEVANWEASFPVEMNSLRSSSAFVKKLMALAVSNITYVRAMFPESAYVERKLADLNLKILSETTSCPAACQLIKWMKGCYEALDYKYLQKMMLAIHSKPSDHDNVIETYIFRFSYKNGVSITCNGIEISNLNECDIHMMRNATISLLRTLLLLTQTLAPLPASYYMTMKLLYYDDVTPPDYEPKGFVPASADIFYFSGTPVNIRVGCLSTPFHSLKIGVKAEIKNLEWLEESTSSASVQHHSSSRNWDSENLDESDNLGNMVIEEEYPINGAATHSVMDPSNCTNMDNGINVAEAVVEEECEVRCPCGSQQDCDLMILCQKCEYWQHAVCFGILEEADAPEIHLCDICYKLDKSKFEPRDRGFYELPAVALKALCIWRRALLCVCGMKTVQPSVLAKRLQIEKSVAVNIINRMEYEKYVSTGSKGRRSVNESLIREFGIPKYVIGTTESIYDDTDGFEMSRNQEDQHDGQESRKCKKASACRSGITFCSDQMDDMLTQFEPSQACS